MPVRLTYSELKRFRELNDIILSCNNDLRQFNRYNAARKEMCRLLGCSDEYVMIYKEEGGIVYYHLRQDKQKPIRLLDNVMLYHTSLDRGLTSLTPRYFHASLGLVRTWKSPRVYWSIANVIDRSGTKYDGQDKVFGGDSYVYVPKIKINRVYRDPEMFGAAVYIESDHPIPVKML